MKIKKTRVTELWVFISDLGNSEIWKEKKEKTKNNSYIQ